MISLVDAQRVVIDACPLLEPVTTAFTDAVGLVLADEVAAGEDVPPFANSAVDGYAVVASDTSVPGAELAVVGELAAGAAPPALPISTGQTIRIMTGAPIPGGADAVVMVEDSELLGGDVVRLTATVQAGTSVRAAGDDVRLGDVVFAAGTVITPPVLGVLASINARAVRAFPRARVTILSTGDELVTDGGPLAPGQIRETNQTMLAPLLEAAGCIVQPVGVVRDDEATLERALSLAAEGSDAIVTSGGVSMGDYDVVKAVLGRIAEMRWMQVAIKPAKPFAFGMIDGVPVLGLPGNPVSSLVSFELFARPALRRMMGHADPHRPRVLAIADDGVRRRPDGKVHLVRVVATFGDDGRLHVVPVSAQGSHQLAATALANALAVVDDGDGIPPGGDVPTILLTQV
ncbi:MAG: moeA [Desertimonas sp.]|nr:moeA [Desertimonas sp.]